MTKLEQLLAEYCPEGVEYRKLGEVCNVFTGGEPPVDFMKSKIPVGEYVYPIYSNGIGENALYGYSKSYRIEEDAVTFSSIGTLGHPTLRKGKFIPIIRLKVFTAKDKDLVDISFIKYVLETISFTNQQSSVPNMNANMVKNFVIPLPPLPIQREIVRILDNFSLLSENLAENLAEELAARKKQYEYYRDKLLTFGEDVPRMKVSEICHTFIGLVTTMTKHYVSDGVILIHNSDIQENFIKIKNPVFLDRQFADENKNRRHSKGDIVTVHTGDVGTSAIIDDELDGSIGFATIVSRVRDSSVVNKKYLCYFFNSKKNKNNIAKITKGDRDNLNLKDHNNLLIPVPPLAEQERIVKILDKFDTLCHDLTIGLPAEIEARRKQYEYYRDKLLRFEEKKKDV